MTDARGDQLSRRSVLAGGGLLLVAACTGSTPVPVTPLTADQRLASRVSDEITVLAAAYAATIATHPSTRGALGPLAAEHEAHRAALVELLPAPTASATPSASASPTASPPVVPASPAEALAALAVAERAAAARRRGQAGHAGPELARLLASIAACEAVHATLVKK